MNNEEETIDILDGENNQNSVDVDQTATPVEPTINVVNPGVINQPVAEQPIMNNVENVQGPIVDNGFNQVNENPVINEVPVEPIPDNTAGIQIAPAEPIVNVVNPEVINQPVVEQPVVSDIPVQDNTIQPIQSETVTPVPTVDNGDIYGEHLNDIPTMDNSNNQNVSNQFEPIPEKNDDIKIETETKGEKSKTGLIFVIILFILLVAFVFALPYISKLF